MPGRARWIRDPARDLVVAFLWVPFVLAAALVDHDPNALGRVLAVTFLLSFVHQPLTLLLVYGDASRRAGRRRLFAWSPVVFVLAVGVGLHVSLVLVAVVAGLWNAEHTLMQRYGVTRMYARKAGETAGGRLERAMLVSWLVLALVWVAADARTPGHLRMVSLGDVNTQAVEILRGLQPVASVLLVPAVLAAVSTLVSWVRVERSRGRAANPAKHVYVGSTAALFVVILVHPVAGLAGYVGSHALEYFAVVHHSLASPAGRSARGGDAHSPERAPAPLDALVERYGKAGVLALSAAGFAGVYVLLTAGGLYGTLRFVILAAGGLHVFYDGFIWKLRRPDVARSLDLGVAPRAP